MRVTNRLVVAAAVVIIGVASCSSSSEPAAEDAAGRAAADGAATATDNTSGATGATFPGGTFQLTVHQVGDGCLDGAAGILFMPTGTDKPYDLQYPTEIPAYESLPSTFTIKLEEPFSEMSVTLEKDGPNKMKARGSIQTDLIIDETIYGDCHVDMKMDVDLTVVDSDNLDLKVAVEVSDWSSKTDSCPKIAADPCTVDLTMKGRRKS